MPYPPTKYAEFLDGILDRVEAKLRTDPRIPVEVRNNVHRQPPVLDNRAYPILYYEDGEAEPAKFASSGRQLYTVRLRLSVLLKHANPAQGVKACKDTVFRIVEALTGTRDDTRLADANGNSLAHFVSCKASWGRAAVDARQDLVWVGVVLVTITTDYRS